VKGEGEKIYNSICMQDKQPSDGMIPQHTAKPAWGYSESFTVAVEITILGFILEIFLRGRAVSSPQFPANLIMILALSVFLVFIHIIWRQKTMIKWLSSIPCSVSAISVYALLVLLMGFIPQGEGQSDWLQLIGLNHLKNSWPFLLTQFFLLISLGLVVLRRMIPFKVKNIGFLLNHMGLWITLVAAGLGAGDLKRVTIELTENKGFTHFGTFSGNHPLELPFSVKLLDFNIDLYNPKIAVADRSKGEIIQKHGETLPLIRKGFETTLIDWKIKVKEYLPDAVKSDTAGYLTDEKPGSVAAAYVETRSMINGDTVSGWVTSGSLLYEPRFLPLQGSKLLLLTEPEPRKFESLLVLKGSGSIPDTIRLEVNHPFRFEGWKLYQISYDTQMGKYSKISVIEAVHDPWLPLVYLGIFMLFGGTVFLFWLGRSLNRE
jgi:hypothetical protein